MMLDLQMFADPEPTPEPGPEDKLSSLFQAILEKLEAIHKDLLDEKATMDVPPVPPPAPPPQPEPGEGEPLPENPTPPPPGPGARRPWWL